MRDVNPTDKQKATRQLQDPELPWSDFFQIYLELRRLKKPDEVVKEALVLHRHAAFGVGSLQPEWRELVYRDNPYVVEALLAPGLDTRTSFRVSAHEDLGYRVVEVLGGFGGEPVPEELRDAFAIYWRMMSGGQLGNQPPRALLEGKGDGSDTWFWSGVWRLAGQRAEGAATHLRTLGEISALLPPGTLDIDDHPFAQIFGALPGCRLDEPPLSRQSASSWRTRKMRDLRRRSSRSARRAAVALEGSTSG